MCGIVGLVGTFDAGDLERMNTCIRHRGPDDSGQFSENGVGLAMRRLAIIDGPGGHQPMFADDGRFVMVYNGEIFNAGQLRRELENDGHRFATDHSDTEVLLRLIARDGAAALPRLNGMFAFALYDRREGTVFCARDRFGIKPLYFSRDNGRFALASEIKSILALPGARRSPDLQSLFHYFTLHFVPGQRSAFEGIERLPAGHWLRLNVATQSVEVERWWAPAFGSDRTAAPAESAEILLPLLSDAVDRWSISDVPVGCLLSGGLDSSVIVSLLAARGHQLQTFTVGFAGPGEDQWNEHDLARLVAERFGTEHHEIILDPQTLLDDLADMVWSLDEPYGGGLPSWSVFKAMGGRMKVAMTGTGGDELFGNYNKYVFLEGRYRGRAGLGRTAADRNRFEREYVDRYCYLPDQEKREAVLTAAFAHASSTADLLWAAYAAGPPSRTLRDRTTATDLTVQLPDEFLLMTDRFSMAHSVEARTPFLDNELADAVLGMPPALRLDPANYKPLLRRAAAQLLPPELLAAPKRGFVMPLTLWLRGRLRPTLERVLAPARLIEQGLVRPDFFERYAAPHLAGDADETHRLWNMLMFQLWWDVHVLERPLDDLRQELSAK